MRKLIAGAMCSLLSACASVSTIPLTQDTFQLTSRGFSGCSPAGAEKVAFKQAAAETLRRGYDNFAILGTEGNSQITTASIYSGVASYGHKYSQGVRVKMFREGDAAGAQALSARSVLGPKWQDEMKEQTTYSCEL